MLNVSQATEAPVLSFSTERVATTRQLDAWKQVVVDLHGQMCFEGATTNGYRGTLAARRSDAIQLVEFNAAPTASSRSKKQAGSDAICRYELVLVTSGEFELQHCGHRIRLQRGDGALIDMSRPHQMLYGQPLSATLIACDRTLLDAKLPGVTHACGVGFPRDSATLAALLGYADTVRANLDRWQAHEFQCVMAHLVDLAALMLDGQNDLGGAYPATQAALLHRLKQFIHAHLSDDDLTLPHVAAANGISTRYMQKIFQVAGTSPREYLLEARLLLARTLLRQRPLRHSVSSIAYMAGFGSASYFSAAYKRRFGLAARDDAKERCQINSKS
ncbi:helix-turn-helix domain-containing protein [Variovorax sp. J31P207]|uniref:helix-turn-helix domain-containing protein n=1 Tax=Variovorax sp. J31P207 TaxID=3053510 RepID=UPI002578291A|nr:helix-turn-helix domain-containing protein [Variovorax sp. J31P207]MDM0066882.1 helix-turn-helix domain-containing protein [Variovorax sp. J31P207]